MSSTGQYQSAVVYNGGIYTSTYYGMTGTWQNTLSNTLTWKSISVSSTGKYQTAIVQNGNIYVSTNYGINGSWNQVTTTSLNWISVSISSTGQYQVAAVQNSYIYGSTNYGSNWSQVTSVTQYWVSTSISPNGQYQVSTSLTSGGVSGYIYFSTYYGISGSWYLSYTRNFNYVSIATNNLNVYCSDYNGNVYVSYAPYLYNQLRLTSDASLNANLYVGGNSYLNGNLGIGVSAPLTKLDVASGTASGTFSSASYMVSGSVTLGNTTSVANSISNYSIYSRGSILVSGNIVAAVVSTFSDERIKSNISNIDDPTSLSIVSQLQPRIFNYIDTLQNGSQPTYGFIAQEVEKVLPIAVSKTTKYIPNIYEIADISINLITLQNSSTTQFIADPCGNPIKVKLYDELNNEIDTTISTIIDDKNFKITNDLDLSSAFVYGQEVDDFRVINKDVIFSVTTSAIQELTERVNTLENQLSSILSILQRMNINISIDGSNNVSLNQ
jgi:hypothetical protein